ELREPGTVSRVSCEEQGQARAGRAPAATGSRSGNRQLEIARAGPLNRHADVRTTGIHVELGNRNVIFAISGKTERVRKKFCSLSLLWTRQVRTREIK